MPREAPAKEDWPSRVWLAVVGVGVVAIIIIIPKEEEEEHPPIDESLWMPDGFRRLATVS